MIGSRQDLASMLLVVAFDLYPLGELVWLTRDLIEFSEGDGKCHEVVIHFANQHGHLFDKFQVVFCLLMFFVFNRMRCKGLLLLVGSRLTPGLMDLG